MISVFPNVALGHLDDLKRLILAMSESGTPSYPSTNVGAWKSNETFFNTPHHAVMRLKMELAPHVLGLNYDGWAMVSRQDTFHPLHQHTNVLLSGVFYVDPGDPPTPTIFQTNAVEATEGNVVITPTVAPGTLVTFPENLWHYVPHYHGTRPRITIVLNAKRELNR